MSSFEEAARLARDRGDYSQLLSELPYGRFIGAQAGLIGEQVRVHVPFQDHLVGNFITRVLHGGVVGAALEMAALAQLVHERGIPLPKTIDFTVDYLRAASAESLYAVADVQRVGRRVANVRMHAYQADDSKPVALGRGNFLLG